MFEIPKGSETGKSTGHSLKERGEKDEQRRINAVYKCTSADLENTVRDPRNKTHDGCACSGLRATGNPE